jgi:predicted nucleic acid-binding protein
LKAALDTNIPAYAEGMDDPHRQDPAATLLASVPTDRWVIPVQVLGELYNILVRKLRLAPGEAAGRVGAWQTMAETIDTTAAVMTVAMALSAAHQLTIWDSLVLPAASRAGCRLLISEDLQNGFTWGGVTVVNPFASNTHPLLGQLLR